MPQPTHADSIIVPLGPPETRSLGEAGIRGIELRRLAGGERAAWPADERGMRFLQCVGGSAELVSGPWSGPCEKKEALVVPCAARLSLRALTPDNRWLVLRLDEESPLLPTGLGPFTRRVLSGNPQRLWELFRHLAFDLQSAVAWRRETAALGAVLSLRLLSFYLTGLGTDGREGLRRAMDECWSQFAARLGAPWTLETMAEVYGTSSRQFDRHCRQVFAESPVRHLASLRLERAKLLLSTSFIAVAEVARLVGYDDAFAFSTAFKRRFGMSPREARGA